MKSLHKVYKMAYPRRKVYKDIVTNQLFKISIL